jgi:hypothetical protein
MTQVLPDFPDASSLIRMSRQRIKEARETAFKIDTLLERDRRLGLNTVGAPGNQYTTEALSKITGSGP